MNAKNRWDGIVDVDAASGALTVTLPPDFSTLSSDPSEDGTLLNDCRQRIINWASQTHGAKILVRLDSVLMAPSAVFGWLMVLQRDVVEHGGQLHVSGMHPRLMELVTLLQLERILRIFPTAAEARGAYAR